MATGGMLAGRTAAEVFAANHNVTGLYAGHKGLVNVLHAVSRKLLVRCGVKVASRG